MFVEVILKATLFDYSLTSSKSCIHTFTFSIVLSLKEEWKNPTREISKKRKHTSLGIELLTYCVSKKRNHALDVVNILCIKSHSLQLYESCYRVARFSIPLYVRSYKRELFNASHYLFGVPQVYYEII